MQVPPIFIHGLYFAHNIEPDILATQPTHGASLFQYGGGLKQFEEADKVPNIWHRSADGNFH
jgi:hypothetical protein